MRNRLARWAAVEKAREAHGPRNRKRPSAVISWCPSRRIPKNAYAPTVKRPSPLSIAKASTWPRATSSLRAGWWRAVSPRNTHARGARPPRPRYIFALMVYIIIVRCVPSGMVTAARQRSRAPDALQRAGEPLLRRGGPLSSLFFVHDRETEVRSLPQVR